MPISTTKANASLYTIEALWQTCLLQGYAAALCQLPQQNTQHLIIDIAPTAKPRQVNIENRQEQGFIVSPFYNPELKHSYFIKANLHFEIHNQQPQVSESELLTQPYGNAQPFFEALKASTKKQSYKPLLPLRHEVVLAPPQLAQHYQDLVSKGRQAIEQGIFQKVVLSKAKLVPLKQELNALAFFQAMCKQYPHAFVYLWYIPSVGYWAGASPEILISVDQHQIFRTVALAGTQKYEPSLKLSKVQWTQKEIEEQALVSRYIINCFKKVRLREFEEEGPKTVVAANLVHLKTFFSVDMQATNFPNLGAVMLALLHPTSAVCGMPQAQALDFILQNEGYERSFYSGFLGLVNIAQETHLFVNLRCLQILDTQLCLYAGAGITEDSEPEKEWQETEIKCQTMLQVLASLSII